MGPSGGRAGGSDALLTERVPAGVDEAAYVKAAYLAAIAKNELASEILAECIVIFSKLVATK